jgi:hypothetical protein
MATTTKILATVSRYGNAGSAAYNYSGRLYVGTNDNNSNYRARATFPSIRTVAAIGDANIVITKVTLSVRRDSGSGSTTVTAGTSADANWGAVTDGSATLTTTATQWYHFDITNCAQAILNYTGNWYVHFTSSGKQIRFNGIEDADGAAIPYINVTWEYANSTITTGTDLTVLGNTVNFTIAPEEDYHSYNISYEFGSQTGAITSGTTATSYSWTPPLDFAREIPNSLTSDAKVTMHVFNSAGTQIRTEILYVTLKVPDNLRVKIVSPSYTNSLVNGFYEEVLAGKSYLIITPTVDTNNSYGGTIKSFSATIENEGAVETLTWNTFILEDSLVNPQQYHTAEVKNSKIFSNPGTVKVTYTTIDSRGLEDIIVHTYTSYTYHEPTISNFKVERYETITNDDGSKSYIASDIGDKVWVSFNASCENIELSDGLSNNLTWVINVTYSDGSTNWGESPSSNKTSFNYVNNRSLLPGTVSLNLSAEYELIVTDSTGNSVTHYASVSTGRANFALAISKFGAGFGCLPKGTEEEPMLESAYPIYAYGGMSFTDESSENSQIIRFFRGTEAERDEHNKQNGDIWFVTLGGN